MSEIIDHQSYGWNKSLRSVTYSPLSFSQNVHQELGSLVRDALLELEVSDQLLNDFDSHSTITIDMNEKPSINISLVDNARRILPVITTAMEYVETGHLTLGKCPDGFELKALVDLRALTENKFKGVIHNFHEALQAICDCR